MEIIIGREEGGRRLHCIVGKREFNVGQAGSVPMSVSRKHCKIIVNGNNITIENLKPQNVTFVDGNQIFSKGITSTSKVQLGNEKFTVPLQQILHMVSGVPANPAGAAQNPSQPAVQTYSLRPLKAVWEEYDNKKIAIQEAAAKSANMSRLQGILSMSGMCIGFIPGIDQTLRIVIVIAALGIAVYFFFKGMSNDIVQKQIRDLDEEYAKKYKCPNPNCGKPFGTLPYRQIEYNKQCFACGCKYTH